MWDRFKEYFFTTLGLINVQLESIIVLFVVFGMFVIAVLMTVFLLPFALVAGVYRLIEMCYIKLKGVKQQDVQS